MSVFIADTTGLEILLTRGVKKSDHYSRMALLPPTRFADAGNLKETGPAPVSLSRPDMVLAETSWHFSIQS
jgi:hypothetical protein